MSRTTDFINSLTDEEKTTMILDFQEITFSLATALRTLEVFAESSVEFAQMTDSDIDFSSVGIMLLTLRGDENGEQSPLTEKAREALDHPKVAQAISMQLEQYAEEEYGLPLANISDDGLQEIIDAIEVALANGDTTLDALSKYL